VVRHDGSSSSRWETSCSFGCELSNWWEYLHSNGCDVAENEEQIYECAGLRIEEILRLLHIEETDSQM
jgi:hypothetical protein